MRPTSVLATITGRDRPGVTAALFATLAGHDVEICDVEQVVIRDRFILSVLFDLRGDPAAIRNSLNRTAAALGMECDVAIIENDRAAASGSLNGAMRRAKVVRSHVTVIGHPLRPGAVSHVAQRLADMGANIEGVTQLSTAPAAALELVVSSSDPVRLRSVLVRAAEETGVDIAIERAGLMRRAKRLVVVDVDSTLIRQEGIDELAKRAGVAGQVGAITARAMAGHLDFGDALRQRVALLAGMSEDAVLEVRDALKLTPGARTFVRTLRRLGYHVGVVSGGFTILTDRFVGELELEFAAANTLEIVDGRVTGRVTGPLVDRAGKAAALRRFADQFDVPLDQTVAIGDGANDVDMLETAGLGIAFNAKAALRAAADASINVPYLDSVLFVLGISRDEIGEAAHDAGV